MTVNPTEIAEEIAALEKKQRDALATLLDQFRKSDSTIFAQRAEMGGTASFLSSVSLNWIKSNVRLANQLPLFHSKIDPVSGRLSIDEESVHWITQREVNWARQAELAEYLVSRRTHKFPPILVVITCPWVDDPTSDKWDSEGRAKESVADFTPLDRKGDLGLLDIDNSEFTVYALDGQHRKIGIDGALDLVSTGRLSKFNREKKPDGDKVLSLDLLIEEHDLDPIRLQTLGNERIGVEIIPAVVAGETREEAQRRIRSVFTHVNKQAAPLDNSQLAQLDEDNGFAIVARRAATEHPLLKRARRVNLNNSTIALKSASLTTLQAVKEMAHRFLSPQNGYAQWSNTGRLLPVRPSDEDLERGLQQFIEFLDHFSSLPSMMEIQRGTPVVNMRRFGHEKPLGGRGHMLFRPVGQVALAQAVGVLIVNDKVGLDEIFEKLRQFDEDDGFRLDTSSNPWWGVLFDFTGKRMRIKGRDTAARIIRYLISGLPTKTERDLLLQEIALARSLGKDDEYRNYDHEVVARSGLKLPPVL